ncbi:MAG: hypothetical protein WCY93_08705 [Anaerolineaceae bacterium]
MDEAQQSLALTIAFVYFFCYHWWFRWLTAWSAVTFLLIILFQEQMTLIVIFSVAALFRGLYLEFRRRKDLEFGKSDTNGN